MNLLIQHPKTGALSVITPSECFAIGSQFNHDTLIALATQMYDNWLPLIPDIVKPKDNYLFQRTESIKLIANAIANKNSILCSGTGTGKTFMLLAVLDCLTYYGFIDYLASINNVVKYPFPILVCTVNPSVEQFKQDAKQYPHLTKKIFIINYEQLRAKQSFASLMVEFKKESEVIDISQELITNAKEHLKDNDDTLVIPVWNDLLAPPILILDEIQKTKNNGALQTQIVQSYLTTFAPTRRTLVIGSSATPFVRPSESKTCALLTGVCNITNYNGWLRDDICNYGRIIPTEYSPAAMGRITEQFEQRGSLITVTDVKFKHKSINKHTLIDFTNGAERIEYNNAYLEWLETLAKIDRDAPSGMGEIFASILKFRQAASWIRRYVTARVAYQQMVEGNNVIIATAFTKTRQAIIDILNQDYNVFNISSIHGSQTREQRWKDINLFQDDINHVSVNMLQAGGTGLSMHQFNARNKRPRFVVMEPVWSIIEMLQMLGRAHRINSDSTTHQWILWYRGTIEEQVAARLKAKALSARELLKKKEQWSDLFTQESERQHIKVDMTSAISSQVTNGDDEDNEQDETFNSDAQLVAGNIEQV